MHACVLQNGKPPRAPLVAFCTAFDSRQIDLYTIEDKNAELYILEKQNENQYLNYTIFFLARLPTRTTRTNSFVIGTAVIKHTHTHTGTEAPTRHSNSSSKIKLRRNRVKNTPDVLLQRDITHKHVRIYI